MTDQTTGKPGIAELCDDLEAEHEALDAIVAAIDSSAWDTLTPAEGWTARDQIAHLTYIDERATDAVADPEAFAAHLTEAAADPDNFVDQNVEFGREMEPAELLERWRASRARMVEAFRPLDAKARIFWYGPPMSAPSFITARLMETWAHGQDIVDALGAQRDPTDRLRHIAHLGVRARPYSYTAHGMTPSDEPVLVELKSPSGEVWTWGDANAGSVVSGEAEDFCLVVTQRRHPDDTALAAEGDAAKEWIAIAQCFAGPPGSGREPGQFS